jgi:hypothetical protein
MEYVFNEERIKIAFEKLNKYDIINLVWKGDNTVRGLCKASKTGHGSNLFNKLTPESYMDFYEKLINYANNNKDTLSIYNRGLTLEELYNVANEFKTTVEIKENVIFPLIDYVDYIMYVNVIQTFDGHINEVMLVNYINNNWYKDAHRATGELDSKYGIDILYRNNTRGIQVKSIRFFYGNKTSVVNDRNNIKPLKDEVKQKFNIDMYYAIFDRENNKYLISSNNTPIFSFEEFITILNSNDKYNLLNSYHKLTV